MSEWVAIIIGVVVAVLQAGLIGVISFLWSEIKSNRSECAQAARESKDDLKFTRSDLLREIALIRDKLNDTSKGTKEDMRNVKAEVMAEILLLRTKVHSIAPVQESIDKFVQFMKDRR